MFVKFRTSQLAFGAGVAKLFDPRAELATA